MKSEGIDANDSFELSRFLAAQENTFEAALRELRRGCKETHWMWFIFPQLAGLGSSPTAQKFGLRNLDEARAYLEHCYRSAADRRPRSCTIRTT